VVRVCATHGRARRRSLRLDQDVRGTRSPPRQRVHWGERAPAASSRKPASHQGLTLLVWKEAKRSCSPAWRTLSEPSSPSALASLFASHATESSESKIQTASGLDVVVGSDRLADWPVRRCQYSEGRLGTVPLQVSCLITPARFSSSGCRLCSAVRQCSGANEYSQLVRKDVAVASDHSSVRRGGIGPGARIIFDTMLWNYIGDEGTVDDLLEAFDNRQCTFVHPPSILLEVLRSSNHSSREARISAMVKSGGVHLTSEAELCVNELVSAVRRFRPRWFNRRIDMATINHYHKVWTSQSGRMQKQTPKVSMSGRMNRPGESGDFPV